MSIQLKELIQSLSLSEKRYFKLFGASISKTKKRRKSNPSNKQSTYLDVYNFYEKQKKEKENSEKPEEGLKHSHVAVAKHYLYLSLIHI